MPGARLGVAVLQLPEQVALQLDGQRGHFVEVERTAAGLAQLVRPDDPREVGRAAVGMPEASCIPTSSASTAAWMATKGRRGFDASECMSRASSDLPVPGSPTMS